MRPLGMVRQALFDAAVRLAAERGGATWRDIAAAAVVKVDPCDSVAGEREQRGVEPELARVTVKNMVKAGVLVSVGQDKPKGSTQWCDLYAPADEPALDSTKALHAAFAELRAFG